MINLDHYEISEKTLETFIQNRPSFFTQNIIVNNKKLKLAFEQVEIHSSDFRITTGDGKEIFPDTKQSLFYRGYIAGDVNSLSLIHI